jgi:hypothetical protein
MNIKYIISASSERRYTLFIDQYGNRWEACTVSELRDSIGGGHVFKNVR